MSLATGQILQGRYHIASHVGQGGMGAVYQAQDLRLNQRLVAVKEFDPAQLVPGDRQMALQAFQREAAILARLSHPGLTAVHDYFSDNGKFYLVMEFVAGQTLQQAWEQSGRRFAEAQVVGWARQLCEVLSYLHNQQPAIIFRDLKPSNIMIQPDGRLKLIDFGIARHFDPSKTSDTVKFGTPGYAAPEQYGQGQTDARSDIYAMGAMMHQLLTGSDPTATPFHLPPIGQIAPHLSIPVRQAVTQALEMDPAKRPFSVQAFSAALQGNRVANGTDIAVKPVWLGAAVAGGILLMLLIGAIGFRNNNQPVDNSITIVETVIVTPVMPTEMATMAVAVVSVSAPTLTPAPTLATEPSPTSEPPTVTPLPTATPITPPPTAVPAQPIFVNAYRPTLNQANTMRSIWYGLQYEEMRTPGVKRYTTTISANEARRWSFIWCGRTQADLENILAPLTFAMLLNGQPIGPEQLLEHDQVVNNWQCRYWSAVLHNWSSGQTVEVEAYYQLSTRIFDGDHYYEPGTYRQIINVRVR